MLKRFKRRPDILDSRLYDQDDFYSAFIHDLNAARSEIIIESPYITKSRIAILLPVLHKASRRGVHIAVNTRHPDEHDVQNAITAAVAIYQLQDIDVTVLFTGKLHRKVAIIDRVILWEGSLNILSQSNSCEIMRRSRSIDLAQSMLQFIKLGGFL